MDRGQPGEGRAGSSPSGRHGHQAAQPQVVGGDHGVGQVGEGGRVGAGAVLGARAGRGSPGAARRRRGRAPRAAVERARPAWRRSTDSTTSAYDATAAALLLCRRADEVPAQAEVGALGGLLRGLLVAVLPHVGDAEVGQEPHVGGGEELGDDHQRHVVGRAAGARAGVGDAAAYDVEVGRELVGAASREPHHAGEAAGGGAVAAVGVQRGVLAGAAADVDDRRRPPASSWARTPAPRSTAGVPHEVVERASGTTARTSSRICCGHLVAGAAHVRARPRRRAGSAPCSRSASTARVRRRAPGRVGPRARPPTHAGPRVGEQHRHAVGGPRHQRHAAAAW